MRLRTELENFRLREYHSSFERVFKENVRTFFGRKCILCGVSENELNKKLSIHHVEYEVYKSCYETPQVPLCPICHRLPHNHLSERPYWIEFLNNIINTQYGGKWCYSKEEYNLIINIDPKIKHLVETYPGFKERNDRISEPALIRFISSILRRKNTPKSPQIASKIKKTIGSMVHGGLLTVENDKNKKFIRKAQTPMDL
jgi:hypothetical protein